MGMEFDPSVVLPGRGNGYHLGDTRNWFESGDREVGEELPPYRPSVDLLQYHIMMGGVFQ